MKACKQQVVEFKENCKFADAKIEKFYGTDGFDVYNPTVPFMLDGKRVIGGRVESRDSEHSQTFFFEEKDNAWHKIEGTTKLDLQDPSIAFVNGELIVSGIRYPVTVDYKGETRENAWVQEFYKGKDLFSLEHFLTGPALMKDIRLCQLNDKRVMFFTRPIEPIIWAGFAIFDKLEDVTAQALQDAPVIKGHTLSDEWGGANQVVVLSDDVVGVIGHKSFRTHTGDDGDGVNDTEKLHYNSVAFEVNVKTMEATYPKIIASRYMLPPTQSKWAKVEDVLFTSGICDVCAEQVSGIQNPVRLYTGVSDCCVGSVIIAHPFIRG